MDSGKEEGGFDKRGKKLKLKLNYAGNRWTTPCGADAYVLCRVTSVLMA